MSDNEKLRRSLEICLQCWWKCKIKFVQYEIHIPYEYIDYVIYNYNHNAVPKETLKRYLDCYHLTIDDVSDVC